MDYHKNYQNEVAGKYANRPIKFEPDVNKEIDVLEQ
jgi:hypothetical protein